METQVKPARKTTHADDLSSARSARNPSTTGSPCGRSAAALPPLAGRPASPGTRAHRRLRLTTCRAMTGSCHEGRHGWRPLQRTRRDTAAAASILRVSRDTRLRQTRSARAPVDQPVGCWWRGPGQSTIDEDRKRERAQQRWHPHHWQPEPQPQRPPASTKGRPPAARRAVYLVTTTRSPTLWTVAPPRR